MLRLFRHISAVCQAIGFDLCLLGRHDRNALSCQVISNVPSAVLLSQFTENYRELLLGVNIGGAGTLIASLASLITFREYTKHYPEKTGKYIALFSACNFGMLALLLGVESLWLAFMG
jgi:Na+/H+ antiporter NhaD/arsenite permease-like protein